MVSSYKNIPGWLSDIESQGLYTIILNTDGPILEIGFCLGRSTSCICEAIRDSGKPRIFDSYDVNCKTREELIAFYSNVHKNKKWEIPFICDEVYSQNLTFLEVTTNNLKENNLLEFVTLVGDNFKKITHRKYDVIFCDAIHDIHEINLNLGSIMKLSNIPCTWLFHDMNKQRVKYILDRIPSVKFDKFYGSLGIFVVE